MMRHIERTALSLAVVIGTSGLSRLVAQQPQGDQCVVNIARMQHGLSVPSGQLRHCGAQGGQVLADSLRRFTAATDTVAADYLRRELSMLRDANILAADLAVATSHSASDVSRVVALTSLVTQYDPRQSFVVTSWHRLLEQPTAMIGCRGAWEGASTGAQLPPDYAARIAKATESVMRDQSVSAAVRSVAACVRSAVRDVPLQIRAQDAAIQYQCDDSYVVTLRDTTGAMFALVDLQVGLGGSSAMRTLRIRPGQSVRFEAVDASRLRFPDGSTAVVRSGHRSCVSESYRRHGLPVPPGIDTSRALGTNR